MTPLGPIRAALAIAPEESRSVGLMMAFGVLIGVARTLLYTSAYGLFLETYGSGKLPMVYVAVALIAGSVSTLYLRLADRIEFKTLLIGNLIFSALATAGLWGLVGGGSRVLLALPIWYELIYVLTTLAYWNLASRVFNVRQGKRLFGLLGTGDRLAETVIGVMTPVLVSLFGTAGLMWLGSVALFVSILPALMLVALDSKSRAEFAGYANEKLDSMPQTQTWRVLRSRYVAILVIQVIMVWLGYYAVDLIFYDRLRLQYTSADDVASFIGLFSGALGAIGLVGQTFASPRILTRIGVRGGILTLPILLLLCMVVVAAGHPFMGNGLILFVAVTTARFCTGAFMGITDAPATLLLYQPLPMAQRMRVQGFIDGIIYPVSVGLAGGVLYVLQHVFNFGFTGLAWSIVLIVGVWTLTAMLLGAEYPKMVQHALSRRLLDDSDLCEIDETSRAILQTSLTVEDPRQVIYAVEMLSRIKPQVLVAHIKPLLNSPCEHVTLAALDKIKQHHMTSAVETVRSLVDRGANASLRCTALETLCSIDDAGLDVAVSWLEAENVEQHRSGLVSILRYGNLHQLIVASPNVLALESSTSRHDKLELADLIARSGTRGFYQPLLPLLQDQDADIWCAAARAAAIVRHPRLVPRLVEGLTVPCKRVASTHALLAYGSALLSPLEQILDNKDQRDAGIIAEILKIIGRIDDERTVDIIYPWLTNTSDDIHAAAVTALNTCKNFVADRHEPWFASSLSMLAGRALRVSLASVALEGDATSDGIVRCLTDELNVIRDRLIDLLCLSHQGASVRKSRLGLWCGDPAEQALSVESLELALERPVRRVVMPIVDPTLEAYRRSVMLAEILGKESLAGEQWLIDIVRERERWPLAWTRVAAFEVLVRQNKITGKAIDMAMTDTSLEVRLHAALFAKRLRLPTTQPSDVQHLLSRLEEEQMLPIEKVAVLRNTEIFSDTPDYVLAYLADIAREQVVSRGESFIHEGAMENHMYVVVDGEIEIIVGGQVVYRHGPGTVVGEMQIIDPAPRSATVRAASEGMLFRIGRESFEQIMADRPEISRAINRMLVQRLRAVQSSNQL